MSMLYPVLTYHGARGDAAQAYCDQFGEGKRDWSEFRWNEVYDLMLAAETPKHFLPTAPGEFYPHKLSAEFLETTPEDVHNIKTNQQIIDDCNSLARKLYAMQGYEVDENFKFYDSNFPTEVLCWEMAMVAYDVVEGTEVDDAINELQYE